MTHSQESRVSSSQDTLLLREENRTSVSALVNGINACLSGDVSVNNEPLKVEKMAATSNQEGNKQQSVYPWLPSFEEACRSALGCKSIKKLESLITVFAGHVSENVKDCYTRPNRAAKLRKCINETLMFFHMYYQDVRKPGKRSSYLDLMTELVSMYIDMEIKAACRQKEKAKKITSRVTSALYVLLDKSEDHVLDAILRAKLINKLNKDVCLPMLGKLVNQVPLPLSEMSYVRYVLIFKLFKKVLQSSRKEKQQKSEEEKRINKLAVLKLKPPDNFVEKAKIFTNVLPKIPPKSKKNITHFFMQAKFNLKSACTAFLKGVKEFQESLYGSADKELFCSKQLSVSPVNDKLDGGAGSSNGFSSEMWASLDLESLVQSSQVKELTSSKKDASGKKVKEKVKKKKKKNKNTVKDKKEDLEKIRKKKLKKNKILGVCGDTISMLENKVLGSKKGKGDKKKKKKISMKADLTSSESTDESVSLPETSTIVDSLFKEMEALRKMSVTSLSSVSGATGMSLSSEDSQNVVSTGIVQKHDLSNDEEMRDVSEVAAETSASVLRNERPTTTMSTPMPAFSPVSAVCTTVPPPSLPSYTSAPPPPPPTPPAVPLEQPTTTTPQGGPPPPYLSLFPTDLITALHLKRDTDSRSVSPATPGSHASTSPHISTCSSSVSSPRRTVSNMCAGLPAGFSPSIPPPPLPSYPPPPPPPLPPPPPPTSTMHGQTPVSYLPPLPSSPAPLQPPLPRSPAPPLPPLPSAPAPASSSSFSLPPMSVPPPPLSFLSTIPPPPTPPHHPSLLLSGVLNVPRPPPTPPLTLPRPPSRPTPSPSPSHPLHSPGGRPSQTPPPPPTPLTLPRPPSRPTPTPPPSHTLQSPGGRLSQTPPPPPTIPSHTSSSPVLPPPPIPPTFLRSHTPPLSYTPPLSNSSTLPPLSISSVHHSLFTSTSTSSLSPAFTVTARSSVSSPSPTLNPPISASHIPSVASPPPTPSHSSSLPAPSTLLSQPVHEPSPHSGSVCHTHDVPHSPHRAPTTPLPPARSPVTVLPPRTVTPQPSSRSVPTPPPSRNMETPPRPASRVMLSVSPSRSVPTPPLSRSVPTPPLSRSVTSSPLSCNVSTPPLSHTIPTPPSRSVSPAPISCTITPSPPPPSQSPSPSSSSCLTPVVLSDSPSSPPPDTSFLTTQSIPDASERSAISPDESTSAPVSHSLSSHVSDTAFAPSSPDSECADAEVSVTVTVATPVRAPSPVPPPTPSPTLVLAPPSYLEQPTTTTQAVDSPSKITVVPTALLTASHLRKHKDPDESSPADLVSASAIPCFSSPVVGAGGVDVGAEVEVQEETEAEVTDTLTSQVEELTVKQEIGENICEEKMTCDSAGENMLLAPSEVCTKKGSVIAADMCIKEEMSYPEEQFTPMDTVIASLTQTRDTVIASGSCDSIRPSSSDSEKKCSITSQICKPEVQGNEAIASCSNNQEKVCMDTVSPRPVRDVLVSHIQRSISKDEDSEAVPYCDSSMQGLPLSDEGCSSVSHESLNMNAIGMDESEMMDGFTTTQETVQSSGVFSTTNDDVVCDIIGGGELFGSHYGLGLMLEPESPAIEAFDSSDRKSYFELLLHLGGTQLDYSQYGCERQDVVVPMDQDVILHNGEIGDGSEENVGHEPMSSDENADENYDDDDDNGFHGRPRTAWKHPASVILDVRKDASPSSSVENDGVLSSLQSSTVDPASGSLFPNVNDSSCTSTTQQTLQTLSPESREDCLAEQTPSKAVAKKSVEETPRRAVQHGNDSFSNRTVEVKLHQLSRESVSQAGGHLAQETTKAAQRGGRKRRPRGRAAATRESSAPKSVTRAVPERGRGRGRGRGKGSTQKAPGGRRSKASASVVCDPQIFAYNRPRTRSANQHANAFFCEISP